MAVIHISEAEAAKDFTGLMAKARAGEEIYIDGGSRPVRITTALPESQGAFTPLYTQPRLISEILADLKRNPSSATLDDQFGNDLEEIIRSHEHERSIDPWEAS